MASIRKNVDPSRSATDVRAIRQTRSGAVLVEINRSENETLFKKSLSDTLGDDGKVKSLTSKVTLEILDIDVYTTKEDVEEAVKRDINDSLIQIRVRVRLTKPNSRGLRLGILELESKNAMKLLDTSRIKIGWVNCRIRKRVVVTKCYKCLDYGHQSRNCPRPDRSKLCHRCGKEGHKSIMCTSEARCVLCTENSSHMLGTGECAAFRRALAAAKNMKSK